MTGLQAELFNIPPITGLRHHARLLGAEEQRALIAELAQLPLAPFEFQQWLGKRRVVSFGWRYDFGAASLSQAPPLPAFLRPLQARAAAWAGLPATALAQALVTEYAPGAGIGWHRDRPVFDIVVGVSLGAACSMRFRRRCGRGFERASQALEPGSAYMLAGAARHDWEHSIAPLPALRYSVTFRSLTAPA